MDTNINSEQNWLILLSEGNEKGLKLIFDQYYKYLLVTASNYVSDTEKAKDIVQDVFFELWKKRDQLNIQNLKSYLRRATINRSLNHIKSDKRFQWGDEAMDSQREDTSITADQTLEINDLQDVINLAIESLPERCQLIFKMSRIEQLTHKEIAQKLDISPKTIENQMTKALKTIRNAVRQYGINPILLLIFQYLILFT